MLGRKQRMSDAQTSEALGKVSVGHSLLGKIEGVSTLEFYTHLATEFVLDGSQAIAAKLRDDQMQIEFDRTFTADCIKMYFFINSFPPDIDYSILAELRAYVASPLVKVNFNMNAYPHPLDWESYELKSKRAQWTKDLKDAEIDRMNRDEILGTIDDATSQVRQTWLARSWAYMLDADIRGRAIILTDTIIELQTIGNGMDASKALKEAVAKLFKFCAMKTITIKKIRNILFDFLQSVSPFRVMDNNLTHTFIKQRVITDEVMANMCTYTPGGDSELGTLIGVDVACYRCEYRNFKRESEAAENILVIGMTGSGKSATCKSLVLSMLDSRINVIVHDLDGEYEPLCREVGGTIITLSKAEGLYFDATRIGDLTGVEAIDRELYQESRVATTTIFNALADQEFGMTTDELRLFNDAYNEVLQKAGVYEKRRETWRNSYNLTYKSIYDELAYMGRNTKYTRIYGDKLNAFIRKLSIFFETGGLRSYLFQKPISITDITGERKKNDPPTFIVINMELDAASGNTKSDTIDNTLKHLTSNYLSDRLLDFFRSLDEFTNEVVEEFQRASRNKLCRESTMKKITANRKRNGITTIVTNSPRALIQSLSDCSSEIVENINNIMVGKLNEKVIQEVCDTFSLDYCEGILQQIITNPAAYEHCFLTKMQGKGVSVIKQMIPKKLLLSPVFQTRTRVKEEWDDEVIA